MRGQQHITNRNSTQLLVTGALLLIIAVGVLLFLNHAKFASTLEQREFDRQMLLVNDLTNTLEAQLALGVALVDTPAQRALLTRARTQDKRVHAIAILDTTGNPQVISGRGTPALWRSARLSYQDETDKSQLHVPHRAKHANVAAITVTLNDSFDLPAGWLALEYSLTDSQQQTTRAFGKLWPAAILSLALALALLVWLVPLILRHDAVRPDRANRRAALCVAGLLTLVQCSVAWNAYHAFTDVARTDAPLLAATLARTLTPDLERAIKHGIPLEHLRDVTDWLQPALDANSEFASLAISDHANRTLFQVSRDGTTNSNNSISKYRFPILSQQTEVGTLIVGLDLQRQAERTHQLAMEFATLLIIGLLLSLELLHGIGTRSIQIERTDNQDTLAHLRLPLFLFFIGSELPRAFMPMWSKQLAAQPLPQSWDGTLLAPLLAPFSNLPLALRMTLPISIFLLAVALISPYAGRYSARYGPVRLFKLGLVLALAGHALAFLADSLLMLSLARIMAGASFGCISIAAFDYISRDGGGRARGMALYLTAYVAAGICGAGLGALIADRAGFPPVFVLGACCIIFAGFALHSLPRLATTGNTRNSAARGALWRLLRQPRFARLLILIGLPLQIAQQGFLFYWVPLALTAHGERTSFIGMAMMGYFLLILFLNAPSARFADRTGRHMLPVLLCMILAGSASLLAGIVYSPLAILFAVALIGLGWAAGFPAQGALVLQLGEQQLAGVASAEAIGVYRMLERIGAMLAPLLVAILISTVGYAGTAEMIGATLLICTLAQIWLSRTEKYS